MSDEHPSGWKAYFTRDNPVMIIALAIVISLVLTMISLGIYLKSDTRRIVELVQSSEKSARSSAASTVSSSGPLTAKDLETIRDGILTKLDNFDDDADFGVSQVTDSALGL